MGASAVAWSRELVGQELRDVQIGMVMNRGQDAELDMHLLLNSERKKTWAAFVEEVTDVAQAQAATSGAYQTLGGKHGGASGVRSVGLSRAESSESCIVPCFACRESRWS